MIRCKWCNIKNPKYIEYHDNEWCKPNFDDKYLYEMLILEAFQAGLSWECILNKRESFREAFDNFDIDKVCYYSDTKVEELLKNEKIIRNKLKIKATINNSRIFKKIQNEFGSFNNYLKKFTNNKIIYEIDKTTNKLSDNLSKDLQKRGMKFVGSTTIYSYLQAIGVIYSHEKECFMHRRHINGNMKRKVDVRKKYTREAKKMDVTIVKLDELDAYVTLKEFREVTKPYYMYINGELVKKIDKNFTLLEYTPLHENYNVRAHIDDKLNILEYYFDITDGNAVEDGIPYYDDLYLDVVFYQECATKSSTYINLEDRNDLSAALKSGEINQEKYDFAFKVADSLMKELKNETNKFVNRGLEDYLKYRKNII